MSGCVAKRRDWCAGSHANKSSKDLGKINKNKNSSIRSEEQQQQHDNSSKQQQQRTCSSAFIASSASNTLLHRELFCPPPSTPPLAPGPEVSTHEDPEADDSM